MPLVGWLTEFENVKRGLDDFEQQHTKFDYYRVKVTDMGKVCAEFFLESPVVLSDAC